MRLTPWYLVAIAPIAVAGCSGAFLGHLAVLAVTLCIFIGTLSLGRSTPSRTAQGGNQTTSEIHDQQIHKNV
jgi:hypothetical protein